MNTGCIPTKTMVASAYAAHLARRAAEYGVIVATKLASTCRGESEKDAIVRSRAGGVESWRETIDNCTVS